MDLKNPRTQKILIVGIAVAGLVYAYFFSTFLPFGHRRVADERAELESRYQQLSSDLSKARQTLSSEAEVERQYQILNRRWEIASNLLPEERELAELLRKVTLVGQQSGVEFHLFKPQSPIPGEVYVENSVNVEVEGGYHEVGAFLTEVANLDRIVNVSNLALHEVTEESQERTVHANFVATAYTLNPAASAQGTGTTAPAKTGDAAGEEE